ncbi:uncharacterized protein K02A2.6-like [Erpetoichthys calabaricus]|uniref:uncharacterized protein K02A2.6-like n=1 Tax=Erpetoichthys calabaricus TaxID=27687 RepID=UPI00223431E9|nr:uncharacterized protein K02A2.6-like [Erpetoichthys calabaricus]
MEHTTRKKPAYKTTVSLNGQQLRMEVDSGSACSLISDNTYKKLWPNNPPPLVRTDSILWQWSQAPLQVQGKIKVQVEYRHIKTALSLLVVRGQGTSLFGRDSFEALGIELTGVHIIQQHHVTALLEKYAEVFQKICACRGPPISIEVDPTVSPKFFKARPVPFALKQRIDEALDDLAEQGIFVQWATPIVPVTKGDGSLSICGDYRCTVNTAVKLDVYPLPTVAEMFSTLARGVIVTKLDLKQAYQQLVLDEPSSELLTINAHRGLYCAQWLQFGVSAAFAIFQRFMDTLLADILGVQPYLDDILITGKTPEEHDARLEKVLCQISEVGLRLQKDRCVFAATEVEFLGFRVDKEGTIPPVRTWKLS